MALCLAFAATTSVAAELVTLDRALDAQARGAHAQAVRLLRELAGRGDADARYHLAIAYLRGTGMRHDVDAARTLLDLAAGQVQREAIAQIGYMHASGIGYPRDDRRALNLYRRAAELDEPVAMGWLGNAYASGRMGIERNMVRARTWFQRGALLGDVMSQMMLAQIYVDGEGVAADPVLASAWTRVAARLGNSLAMLADTFPLPPAAPVQPGPSVAGAEAFLTAIRQNRAAADLQPAPEGNVEFDIQRELRKRGYDPGLPDGVDGPRTRAALASFQSDHGLPARAKLDAFVLSDIRGAR